MKKNVGTIDRGIRIIVGIAAIAYAVLGGSSLGYLGIVPLLTGLLGWCPPYSLLGISTCGKCSDGKAASGCACESHN